MNPALRHAIWATYFPPHRHLGGSPFHQQIEIQTYRGVQIARFRLSATKPAMPAPTPTSPITLGSGTAAMTPGIGSFRVFGRRGRLLAPETSSEQQRV